MAISPIVLMSADDIGTLIKSIEKELPGYWYSISQTKEGYTVSLGPTIHCLLDADRAWSLTEEGDKGIVACASNKAIALSKMTPNEFFYSETIPLIRDARKKLLESLKEFPAYTSGRRIHDRDARQRVRKKYAALVREIPTLCKNFVDVEEIYIGSCHTSADCSIRGKYLNRPFDFSNDLTEESSTMDQSIEKCLIALKESFISEKV